MALWLENLTVWIEGGTEEHDRPGNVDDDEARGGDSTRSSMPRVRRNTANSSRHDGSHQSDQTKSANQSENRKRRNSKVW